MYVIYVYIYIYINFPNAMQELEIEAFTCTVLRCVKKKEKKKKNLPSLRPLRDSTIARLLFSSTAHISTGLR